MNVSPKWGIFTGIWKGRFDDIISVAKAKAIVTAYRTFDGIVWINPLLDQWKEVHSGKKLVKPVTNDITDRLLDSLGI